jgi:hypothetical protein
MSPYIVYSAISFFSITFSRISLKPPKVDQVQTLKFRLLDDHPLIGNVVSQKSVPSEFEKEKLNGKPSQANAIFVCDGFLTSRLDSVSFDRASYPSP